MHCLNVYFRYVLVENRKNSFGEILKSAGFLRFQRIRSAFGHKIRVKIKRPGDSMVTSLFGPRTVLNVGRTRVWVEKKDDYSRAPARRDIYEQCVSGPKTVFFPFLFFILCTGVSPTAVCYSTREFIRYYYIVVP